MLYNFHISRHDISLSSSMKIKNWRQDSFIKCSLTSYLTFHFPFRRILSYYISFLFVWNNQLFVNVIFCISPQHRAHDISHGYFGHLHCLLRTLHICLSHSHHNCMIQRNDHAPSLRNNQRKGLKRLQAVMSYAHWWWVNLEPRKQ